jgi:hypothetical protein
VVQEPLPQVRVCVDPAAGFDPPPMLKLMELITLSRSSAPHLEQTISIWSWLLLTSISVTSLHFKHLNSYMGITVSLSSVIYFLCHARPGGELAGWRHDIFC